MLTRAALHEGSGVDPRGVRGTYTGTSPACQSLAKKSTCTGHGGEHAHPGLAINPSTLFSP